jgi:hypothetical protein
MDHPSCMNLAFCGTYRYAFLYPINENNDLLATLSKTTVEHHHVARVFVVVDSWDL